MMISLVWDLAIHPWLGYCQCLCFSCAKFFIPLKTLGNEFLNEILFIIGTFK